MKIAQDWKAVQIFLARHFLKAIFQFVLAVSALSVTDYARAAPQQLYGKTVVVTWQEERQQKAPGDEQMRLVAAAAEFDVYVSETGRPFSRLRFSVANKRGKLRSGTRDAVQGESGGSSRNVSFSGSTMTASMRRGIGGALGLSVNFDNGFQSCTARTVSGKEGGVAATRGKSFISGRQLDIYSIKTGGESCRIQTGNMFAH